MGSLSDLNPDQVRVVQIFHPEMLSRVQAVARDSMRFVHYTTAEAAMKILQGKAVWMRMASCMDDYMEVEHGLECLATAYRSPHGKELQALLNGMFDGVAKKIEDSFNQWQPRLVWNTYITCISEHDGAEDTTGRLSMWRAYGANDGVAFVLTGPQVVDAPNPIVGPNISPVEYLDDKTFQQKFSNLVERIKSNRDFLAQFGQQALSNVMFGAFRMAALCTKHPGFYEEREWRIYLTPQLDNVDALGTDIQAIRGSPQPVFKLPLHNIPALLDRLIIGPTRHPTASRSAFVELLRQAGIAEPETRVFTSDIPLRR